MRTRLLLLLLSFLFFSGPVPTFATAGDYDSLVQSLRSESPEIRSQAEANLAQVLKKELLNSDPEESSNNRFAFGHFINSLHLDVAIGISFPPYRGNLVVLTRHEGRYIPAPPVVGIGFVESLESIRLFAGSREQLVLNLFGGGSGWRHWAKDIYRWDGSQLRMIWAWVREDVYSDFRTLPQGDPGYHIRAQIEFRNVGRDRPKEILTVTTREEGFFTDEERQLSEVTSRREQRMIHRWDKALFYYVAKYGRILPPNVTVRCWEGIPGKEISATLRGGMKIGILENPAFRAKGDEYRTIVGKERFCTIPRAALRLIQ